MRNQRPAFLGQTRYKIYYYNIVNASHTCTSCKLLSSSSISGLMSAFRIRNFQCIPCHEALTHTSLHGKVVSLDLCTNNFVGAGSFP